MVANISTGNDVYGALAFNQQKVDKGAGAVLATHLIREPTDGRFSVAETSEDLLRWMPSHYRTEKPVVHISLNPDPADHLTDEQLADIAQKYMERMGWGGQPYIVFKHTDIDREHIHLVTVQVARDGRKIKDSMRNERSVAITEQLEEEYGLRPAKGQTRSETWQFTPVDYTKGNLKNQIAAVVKPAATKYRFQSLPLIGLTWIICEVIFDIFKLKFTTFDMRKLEVGNTCIILKFVCKILNCFFIGIVATLGKEVSLIQFYSFNRAAFILVNGQIEVITYNIYSLLDFG